MSEGVTRVGTGVLGDYFLGTELKWKKVLPTAVIPAYKSRGAACFDICTAEDFSVSFGEVATPRLGLSVEIPEGYELQIRMRSGLAVQGLALVNGVGTIDSDYRGELKGLFTCVIKDKTLTFKAGDRIAQGCVQKVLKSIHVEVEQLSETERGSGGFGSTGIRE